MKRAVLSFVLPLLLPMFVTAAPVGAAEYDKKFFQSVRGEWVGPGEIVAGKYKGTKFNCSFAGSTPARKLGMTLEGGCRVGLFTQKMSATIESSGRTGYEGTFMDGAKGSGLDIVSGSVIDSRKVVLGVRRNQLNGLMQARMADNDTMTVTVSVKVDDTMVPVIGMNLKRVDSTAVGSIPGN